MENSNDSRDFYPNCDITIWLRNCEKEVTESITGVIQKEIPKWLEGCLLRNGPGNLKVGNTELQHLFDGEALLHRFNISNGTVTYQNRFLKSETYKRNHAAQRLVFSEFGTKSVPDPCQTIYQKISAVFERFNHQSDNAMISIYPFGDEYFTMTETPIVHKIDISDLSTLERINFSDSLGIVSHSSHPHIMPDKTVYNLGMIPSKFGPRYCILEFSPDKEKSITQSGRIVASIPSRWRFHPSYMHTFGITENYYVIVEQPLSISLGGVVLNALGNRPLSKALKWYEKELTVFYVIERKSGRLYKKYVSDAFFYLHIINQYEENEHLVMDICCYNNPSMIDCMYVKALKEGHLNPDYAKMFRGRPLRFVMPLNPHRFKGGESENLNRLPNSRAEAIWKKRQIILKPELICNIGCETPRINYEKYSRKKYRYFYGISSDVDLINPGTLIKIDVETKNFKTWCEDNVYPSEPIFVPNPNSRFEDDGVILSVLIWGREKNSQVGLLVLDAQTWEEVGRAVFMTDGPVPKCLHGWYVNNAKIS